MFVFLFFVSIGCAKTVYFAKPSKKKKISYFIEWYDIIGFQYYLPEILNLDLVLPHL